ncbi:MAG: ATP-binding protein, partial [Microcoleus sp. Co-bin12]|nr:ATP-binding protein [Microcoleus sp. Co-bin12]
MSLGDLANTKVRVLGWSAVMGVAPMIASAIANPGVAAALGVIANPTVGGISILATIAGGIAGNMAANDLGNLIAEKLAKNPNILDNRDLIEAAGEAIADILKDVAKSNEFIAIALSKNSSARDLNRLAEKTPEYWLHINTERVDLSRGLN